MYTKSRESDTENNAYVFGPRMEGTTLLQSNLQISPQACKTLGESNIRAIQQHFTLEGMHEKYTVEYGILTEEA